MIYILFYFIFVINLNNIITHLNILLIFLDSYFDHLTNCNLILGAHIPNLKALEPKPWSVFTVVLYDDFVLLEHDVDFFNLGKFISLFWWFDNGFCSLDGLRWFFTWEEESFYLSL